MPRYDYKCAQGHVTEHTFSMADVPAEAACGQCRRPARRVFAPPAAIHFHGPGFYATDVKGRMHRRRRKNPGDDLPKDFDVAAAAITGTL